MEYRKDNFPQPLELIRQLVGIAYGCIKIHVGRGASTPLHLYARTVKASRNFDSQRNGNIRKSQQRR